MKSELLEDVRSNVKNWWISLVIGILSLILGIIFIFQPIQAFFTLSVLFVIGFIVAGICEIAFAISNKNIMPGWGWTLAVGIIDILLGILLLFIPSATPWVMVYFVGFWILFQSIWGIGITYDLQRSGVKDWGWLLALSIIGVILSFIFILSPAFASEFIVIMAALAFITYGIFRIYLAIQYKSLKNKVGKHEIEVK